MPDTSAQPLTTREIADRYRRDVNTVAGWINEGVYAPSGERIHLRATKVGGCWNVDPADLVAFLRALNPETRSSPAGGQDGDAARRRAAADRRMHKLGLE